MPGTAELGYFLGKVLDRDARLLMKLPQCERGSLPPQCPEDGNLYTFLCASGRIRVVRLRSQRVR